MISGEMLQRFFYLCFMMNQKEDITNYLGRALFVVLFFLLIGAFSDQSVKPSGFPIKVQLVTESHPSSIIADAIQLPLFQKNLASFIDKNSFQLFNTIFKRFADNKKFIQRFISLQQTELLIKPSTLFMLYYHLIPEDTGDVPILG